MIMFVNESGGYTMPNDYNISLRVLYDRNFSRHTTYHIVIDFNSCISHKRFIIGNVCSFYFNGSCI